MPLTKNSSDFIKKMFGSYDETIMVFEKDDAIGTISTTKWTKMSASNDIVHCSCKYTLYRGTNLN